MGIQNIGRNRKQRDNQVARGILPTEEIRSFFNRFGFNVTFDSEEQG